MTHSTRKTAGIPVTIFLIPLLVSMACITLTGGSSSDSPPGEITIEHDLTFGPGTFIFTNPRAGLAELTSYQATLTLSFDGTREGNTDQWSKTYTMLATNEPLARQWTIEQTGGASDPLSVFLAEMDGVDYERLSDQTCSGTEIQEGDSLTDRLELAAILTGVIGAEEAGSETVNNIPTIHYTFDQRALGEDGFTEATGEFWVASEGGYIVRYLLTTKAGEEYFGEGIEGTLSTAYNLIAPNQPVTIELPEDCPPGMIDTPVLPDASNIVRLPGLLSYDTPMSAAEAAAFHQEQIPALGWVLEGEPAIGEDGAFLTFRRGEQVLTVIIRQEGDITEVILTVNRLGP